MDPDTSSHSCEKSDQIQHWLRAARHGSNGSLGQLFEACRGYMLLVANCTIDSQLRQKVGASDLVQDTFLEAQRDFAQFRGATEREFYAWLTQILINRLRNTARSFRYTLKRDLDREIPIEKDLERFVSEIAKDDYTPGALVAAWEEEQRVKDCMQRLSDVDRQVVILRSWEEQSFVQIGQKIGRTPDAARQNQQRNIDG